MFFVGISCTVFPYLLALIFAGLLFGGATKNDIPMAKSFAETNIISYQTPVKQTVKAYHFQQYACENKEEIIAPLFHVDENCWKELCFAPIKAISLINPIKRGPPQVIAAL